ncbi:MAG: hemolysin family protein [Hydrogenophaga sp.]
MDILLIVFLTLLNGAFAMSEMSLAASRKARLAALAETGDRGAQTALHLLEHPTQFLSSVQVGITSIGMLNGIVGEAAFSGGVARWLGHVGLSEATASGVATALVVVVITFVTIVFGELVPKRIGQLFPETVARWVSRPMALVARVAKPFVWLLTHTTQGVLKLLRIDTGRGQQVTEEEIAASLEEGVDAGIIEAHEHRMVRNVFLLDDRQLISIMVPRADIHWLDADDTVEHAVPKAWSVGHSWYPVCRGGLDEVVGVIHLPRLLALREEGAAGTIGQHALPATFVPETLSGMELLEQFRARATRMAFVVDEYGVVQGLLTPLDLLEAITGELSPGRPVDAWATPLDDGSWQVDGAMPVAELKARLGIDSLPDEDRGRYNTVAGLMQTVQGQLLAQGDHVDVAGWRLEVTHLEGRRIDQVHIRPQAPDAA